MQHLRSKNISKTSMRLFNTVAIIALASSIAMPAMAQIDEIVVTARKQAENIQEVPIAITAFTGEDFQNAGLQEFSDIALITPNLAIDASAAVGSSFSTINIRGQEGGFITLNIDEAVGVYINNAPITRATGLLSNIFDVEAVEVLKGPQGTLYGRNTTGGAVVVTTKAPELNEFGGYVEATFGNFGRNDYEGVVNIPIAQDLAALRLGPKKPIAMVLERAAQRASLWPVMMSLPCEARF